MIFHGNSSSASYWFSSSIIDNLRRSAEVWARENLQVCSVNSNVVSATS